MALPVNAITSNGPGHAPRAVLLQLPSGIYVFAQADANANLLVNVATGTVTQQSPKTVKTVTGSTSSNTAVITAVPGNRLKIQFLKLRTAYSGAILNPILTDGNGGTTLWDDHMQALSGTLFGSNEGATAPSYLFGTTAGNALYLNPGGQTVYYDISYWDSDVS